MPVRPAQGEGRSLAAASSPATPADILDRLFTPTQAAALRDGGYTVLGWWKA